MHARFAALGAGLLFALTFGSAGCSASSRGIPGADGDGDGDGDATSDGDADAAGDADRTEGDADADVPDEPYGEVAPLCWVTHFGGPAARAHARDHAALADGSIVAVGSFEDEIVLGEGEPAETWLTRAAGDAGFLARFDPEGRLIWARPIAARSDEGFDVAAIAALPSGDFMALGAFGGTAVLGAGEAGETTLTSRGEQDIWLARYRADGTLSWARRDGGPRDDMGFGMTAFGDESVVVTGSFRREAVFGSGEEEETELVEENGGVVFVARYWEDGSLRWARAEEAVELGSGVAAHADGSFTLGGWSWEGAVLGRGTAHEVTLECESDPLDACMSVFAARYDADGAVEWAGVGSCPWGDPTVAEAVPLADGSVAIVGRFIHTLTFVDGGGAEVVLTSPIGDRVIYPALYVARFVDDGRVGWALGSRAEPGSWASANAATPIGGGELAVTGTFVGAVTFGEGPVDETLLVSGPHQEPYVAVYSSSGRLAWLARVGRGWGEGHTVSMSGLGGGRFLIAGQFEDHASFVLADGSEVELEAAGERDGFLLEVCPDGL